MYVKTACDGKGECEDPVSGVPEDLLFFGSNVFLEEGYGYQDGHVRDKVDRHAATAETLTVRSSVYASQHNPLNAIFS